MLFILRFVNKPDVGDLLVEYRPAHLAWLDRNSETVLQAGATRTEPNGPAVGALWIVEAESPEAADEVYQSDPYWANGARESVEIMVWTKAFPDRKVPV